MNIKWLKTFVTAAETENFRHASEQLFLSQPAITKHIQSLEEAVGVQLFERAGRNISLTSAGQRFLAHATKILSSYEAGLEDMSAWRQGYSTKLKVAVSPLIASTILPPILKKFMRKAPHVDVSIHAMKSKEVAEAISNGEADVGLTRLQPIQSSLSVQKLADDPVLFAVPTEFIDSSTLAAQTTPSTPTTTPLASSTSDSSEKINMEQLFQKYILLTHNHPEYWEPLLPQLQQKYPYLRTMMVTQVEISKRFIEEGLGISFIPRSIIERELVEKRLQVIQTAEITLPVASTYFIHRFESQEIDKFKQCFRNDD